MSKMTVQALEKKFKNLEEQLREEAQKTPSQEAEAYVNHVTGMMNQTLQAFKAMTNSKEVDVTEKEFMTMLEKMSPGHKPIFNRETRRQQEKKQGVKVNVKRGKHGR